MLRKNGLVKSCEPCRKSKLACDHQTPICGRCERRNMRERCFYHPAPMRRKRKAHGSSPEAPESIVENESPGMARAKGASAIPEPGSSSSRLLSLLEPVSQHSALIGYYLRAGAVSAIPFAVILTAMPALQKLGEELTSSNGYTVVLERLACNAKVAADFTLCLDPVDFLQVCTGENLRWEFVGIIFSLSGISALLFPSQTALRSPAREHAARMLWASNYCVDAILEVGSDSLLTVWLLCENLNLLTMHYGEASHLAWRRLGDLAAMVSYVRLDKEVVNSKAMPEHVIEIRRRLYTSVYWRDKSIATFLGRPPRINAAFSDMQAPSGNDSISAQEHSVLPQSLESVGSEVEKLTPAMLIRRAYFTAACRETVLEASLDLVNSTNSQDKQEFLITAVETQKQYLGASYERNGSWDPSLPPETNYQNVVLHLDYLLNIHLANKQLGRTRQNNSVELIEVSAAALEVVLELIDFSQGGKLVHRDPTFQVLYYGLPCAATLAHELKALPFSEAWPTLTKSRALIVQNLSAFVGGLKWMAPVGHPAQELCERAERSLSRAVDDLLSLGAGYPDEIDTAPNAFPDFDGTLDLSDLDWINSIDWANLVNFDGSSVL